jgi:hypothetical protein
MDALQFSLFFTAILVGYVLVHLRMVRLEEHLQKLAGIRSLDDRLRGLDERLKLLAESFDKVRLDRVEQHLGRLHEDLEDLREATVDVRHAVVEIPAPTIVQSTSDAPVVLPVIESAGQRVRSLIETRLLQLGYNDVRLLSDLVGIDLDHDLEVMVEAERGNMPVKGRVLVRNGSVRDVALQSVVQMFP